MDILSIASTIQFTIFIFLISIVGFPICIVVFKNLEDRGFAFSKLIVILLVSFISWLTGHLLPIYTFGLIAFVLLVLTVISIYLFKNKNHEIVLFVKKHKKLLVIEELLFLGFFIVFILIRLGNPDLWHPVMGGEKPMDFSFINAIVRAHSLPPYDPWLSGSTINYYYFGQFITATIIKLTNIPSAIFYNLFLAYLFGQTALASFSIVYNITKSKKFAAFGSILLLVCGNLGQISVILQQIKLGNVPINGWYWTATRIMPNNEINEFPFFTFIYADLHSHLIGLPIALLLVILIIESYKNIIEVQIKRALLTSLFASVVLGVIRITNIWDYPTFLLFSASLLFLTSLLLYKAKLVKKIIIGILMSFILFVGSNLSVLPFLLTFKTGEFGASLYQGPQTKITDYLIIHGLFLIIAILFVIFHFSLKKLKELHIFKKIFIYLLFISSVILLIFNLPFLAFLFLLITLMFTILLIHFDNHFPLFLTIFAVFLTTIPDIIDIKLGLGRMNTVFKFYFQAWIFYALGTSILAFYIFQKIKHSKILVLLTTLAIGVFLLACLSYPATSTFAKINDRMGSEKTFTLNGTEYMKSSIYFDQSHQINLVSDLNAINWINRNIVGSPIFVEANTPIYRWGGRISVYTGLPVVLGWDWHEIAHRQYLTAEQIQKRGLDIQQIYTSSDFENTKSLLMLYNVSYIYLGTLEKAYYDVSGFENVVQNNPNAFEKVYQEGDVIIYKFVNGQYNSSAQEN